MVGIGDVLDGAVKELEIVKDVLEKRKMKNMSEKIKISFKGIPIHICDKIPKNPPLHLLDKAFGNVCPFCGEKMSDNQTPKRHGSPTFYAMLNEMAEIHDKKSHNYASNDNPHGNYLFAGTIAIMFAHSSLDAGFASRLAEKMYRLSILESGHKTPKNESIDDTERDIATIATLWMAARRDSHPKEQQGQCIEQASEQSEYEKASEDAQCEIIKAAEFLTIKDMKTMIDYLQAVIDNRRKGAQYSKTTR